MADQHGRRRGGSVVEGSAHDLEGGDGELEELDESFRHDYSTSETGVVPLDRRRPLHHFAGLWMTFAAGFSFLFVGFELHAGGYTLPGTIGITLLGIGIYVAYALFASYLGSRTGQTHPLLTRSVFGLTGSVLVSLFLVIGPIGWVGFQAGLMVQIWDGLYGWGHVETLSIVFAVLMIMNNIFGFSGISLFARYVVTPLIVIWVLYLVLKGIVSDSGQLGHHPKAGGLSLWPAVGIVLGFAMWGNEPDIWRYGKPRFWWPLPAYAFALVFGFLLFTVGGWMMAEFSKTEDFGAQMKFTADYSLFGLLWLAFILATVSQYAINDGNYYEAVNSIQNLLGGWRRWKRIYTCALCAAGGGLAAWLVNYVFTNGFFKVAAFLAISVPTATVIMCVDHFLLPRLFGISRPLLKVPAWDEAAVVNWPGLVALVVAVVFGGIATGIMPGMSSTRYWGPAPLITWVLGGVLYVAGVAITRSLAGRSVRGALAFSRLIVHDDIPPRAVIDLASVAEGAAADPSASSRLGAPQAAPG